MKNVIDRTERALCKFAVACVLGAAPLVHGQTGSASNAQGYPASSGKVVVSGVVPDEATRGLVLTRIRELYGADRVVDQLGVDRLPAPPNWAGHVRSILEPNLKQVTQGQLRVSGNSVEIEGVVDSDAAKSSLIAQINSQLNNPTYAVQDKLRTNSAGQQSLDAALARRSIEFEAGNATLTPAGIKVLEDLLPLLRKLAGRRFEITGHTDDSGSRDANVALSAARAVTVKNYLVNHGIPASDIATAGAGPDRPVAPNSTQEGRARNRRIEFRVLA